MNYWKIILATVVIFGAGVLTGGLMVQSVDRARLASEAPRQGLTDFHWPTNRPEGMRAPDPFRPRQPEMFEKQFVQQLDDSLRLTAVQRDKITSIIADGQERNRVVWTNYTPQLRKVMQDVQQKIRAELTPDQLKKFEVMMKPRPPRRPQFPARTNFPGLPNNPPLTPTNGTGA